MDPRDHSVKNATFNKILAGRLIVKMLQMFKVVHFRVKQKESVKLSFSYQSMWLFYDMCLDPDETFIAIDGH